MLPSSEQIERAFRIWVAIALFPAVYLVVWLVCRSVDWPRPSVMK